MSDTLSFFPQPQSSYVAMVHNSWLMYRYYGRKSTIPFLTHGWTGPKSSDYHQHKLKYLSIACRWWALKQWSFPQVRIWVCLNLQHDTHASWTTSNWTHWCSSLSEWIGSSADIIIVMYIRSPWWDFEILALSNLCIDSESRNDTRILDLACVIVRVHLKKSS